MRRDVSPNHGEVAATMRSRLSALGGRTTEWSNGPGVRYETHVHPYRKVLVCVTGSITFHLPSGDQALEAGMSSTSLPGPRTVPPWAVAA